MYNLDNEWLNLYDRVDKMISSTNTDSSKITPYEGRFNVIMGDLNPRVQNLKQKGKTLAERFGSRSDFLDYKALKPFWELNQEWNNLLSQAMRETYTFLLINFGAETADSIVNESCPNFSRVFLRH